MNRQAHIVSLAFIVQRPGQSVTHEMAAAAQTLPTRPARRRRARMKKTATSPETTEFVLGRTYNGRICEMKQP
jgi:hypothetical protein